MRRRVQRIVRCVVVMVLVATGTAAATTATVGLEGNLLLDGTPFCS